MTNPTPPRGTMTTLRALPRALLVDLSPTESDTVTKLLLQEKYLPFRASGADDAIKKLKADRHEFVLVNVEMGAPGAAAFIEALRADEQLSGLPVLVTSATDDIEGIERCLERGADDYLPKALGLAVLKARVSAALDRRRVQDGEALRREMAVARNIQRDFLPESLPEMPGVLVEAALHPARQVSGDFYDAFPLAPSGSLMFVVGDVCDKGVGAALFMALFRSLIRASADPVGGGAIQMIGGRRTLVMQSLEQASPADLLTRVAGFTNNYIARLHGRTNMFATCFLATLDPMYGELVYVNAGHEPALVIAPDGTVEELRPTGPALGMMPDSQFQAVTRMLERDHSLFAFTDGLQEARSPSGDVFGNDRLRDVVRANAAGGAPALINGVLEAMKSFSRQAEPHDDLTMLAATRVRAR